MLLYRVGKTKFARDLSGDGAKLNGGRWNHEGIPCIYAAQSRALSLLEYSAHVSLDSIPRSLSFTVLEVPDNSIKKFSAADLPGNWNAWPHPGSARDFGSKWLKAGKHLVLMFPSAVIRKEFNFVINVLHPRMNEVRIVEADDYAYDIRIKK